MVLISASFIDELHAASIHSKSDNDIVFLNHVRIFYYLITAGFFGSRNFRSLLRSVTVSRSFENTV